jgi:adenylate cyclase
LRDVLALQSELARTIAGQVRAIITPADEGRLQPESVNPAAYEAYIRGRFFLDRWTVEDSAEALHFFQLATELDSNYALAYVGMAECYIYGVAGVSAEDGIKRGFAATTRALELKPKGDRRNGPGRRNVARGGAISVLSRAAWQRTRAGG